MEVNGIETTQVESLQKPFLSGQTNEAATAQQNEQQQKVETQKVQQLAEQVQELPENRPDVVDRGRDLLEDPNYPSADIEEQVARVLLGDAEEAY